MTAPRVLPEYMGGDVGGKIAQAFQMKREQDRQDYNDAVTTGRNLHPITEYEYNNPEPAQSGFGHMIRGAIAKVQGQPNPDDAAHAQWQLGQNASQQGGQSAGGGLSVGVTPSTDQPDGFSNAQPKTPGAFNPLTGGFGPAIPRYAKLPSGQTIDMAYTPFGERLQQAMMNNQLNQTLLGIRGNQRMEQIGAQNDGRQQIADTRGQYQVQTTGMRNEQSNTNNIRTTSTSANNHATVSGSAKYSADHRVSGGGAGPNPVTGLTHVMTADRSALAGVNGQLAAARKNPPNLNQMVRQGQDTTGVMGRFRADTTALHNKAGVMQQNIESDANALRNAATRRGGPSASPADAYEAYRDQGLSHEQAVQAVLADGGSQ